MNDKSITPEDVSNDIHDNLLGSEGFSDHLLLNDSLTSKFTIVYSTGQKFEITVIELYTIS